MLRLRDIMTRDVITIAPEASLRDAMELFSRHHISGAPVVSGQKVVGVISATDILDFVRNAARPDGDQPASEVREEWPDPELWDGEDIPTSALLAAIWSQEEPEVDRDGDGQPDSPRDPLDAHTVSEAMTYGIYALPPTAHVPLAAEHMRAADVHRLLVMEDGQLVGIVTTMDLVQAVADRRLERRTYVFNRAPLDR